MWRDAAHLQKVMNGPIGAQFNDTLVKARGMRILGTTYYGTRHITTTSKEVKTPADLVGFKLRVPENDVFKAMAEAWGAKPTPMNFGELYLALKQNVVDGQENPLPTIKSGKFDEVQKYLVLTAHIITPRLVVVNEAFWQGLTPADRKMIGDAMRVRHRVAGRGAPEAGEGARRHVQAAGMKVITPDVECVPRAGLAKVPKSSSRSGAPACTRRSRPCSEQPRTRLRSLPPRRARGAFGRPRSARCVAVRPPRGGDAASVTALARIAGRAVDALAIATFTGMFLCVLVQVVLRYFFGDPLVWSDELARYLFVWCSFLGWVIAARKRSHLGIALVAEGSPPRVKAALELVGASASDRVRRRSRSTTACRSRPATADVDTRHAVLHVRRRVRHRAGRGAGRRRCSRSPTRGRRCAAASSRRDAAP